MSLAFHFSASNSLASLNLYYNGAQIDSICSIYESEPERVDKF
jgi:hypothetical protein